MRNLIFLLLISACQNPLIDGKGISSFANNEQEISKSETILCDDSNNFQFDSNFLSVQDGKCFIKEILPQELDATNGTGIESSNGEIVLSPVTGCSGNVLNCSSLNADWTPRYSNLLGYWKFNEASGAIVDSSSHGHAQAFSGAGTRTQGVDGKVGNALYLGPNSWISNSTTAAFFRAQTTTSLTYSIWVNPLKTRNSTAQAATGVTGVGGQSYAIYPQNSGVGGIAGVGVSVGTNGISVFEHGSGHLPSLLVHNMTISDWTHIVVVYDNKVPKLYVNGVFIKNGVTSTRTSVFPAHTLGDGSNSYGLFNGYVDEYGVWAEALTAAEILQIYERQATNYSGVYTSEVINAGTASYWDRIIFEGNLLDYQVRSCVQADCSDAAWVGSDGGPNTYFNSLDQILTLPERQYFQYKVHFNDVTSSLSSVRITPKHYFTGIQEITVNKKFNLKSYDSLSVNGSCDTEVKWAISSDKLNWLYWNGSAWTNSANNTETSTLAEINAGLSFYNLQGLYLKAYLNSEGDNECYLEEISISGIQ